MKNKRKDVVIMEAVKKLGKIVKQVFRRQNIDIVEQEGKVYFVLEDAETKENELK